MKRRIEAYKYLCEHAGRNAFVLSYGPMHAAMKFGRSHRVKKGGIVSVYTKGGQEKQYRFNGIVAIPMGRAA